METYPAFLTPRDKEPSLSSFEKKSLENVWLARKQTEKTRIYKKNRASALFVDSIYDISIYFYILDYMILLHDLLRTSSRELYIKKITKQNI